MQHGGLLTDMEFAIGCVEDTGSDKGGEREVDEVEAKEVEFALNPLPDSGVSVVESVGNVGHVTTAVRGEENQGRTAGLRGSWV